MTPRIVDIDAINEHLDRALHLARLIDQAAERVEGDPLLAGEIEALADAINTAVNRAIELGELSPHAPAEAAALIEEVGP